MFDGLVGDLGFCGLYNIRPTLGVGLFAFVLVIECMLSGLGLLLVMAAGGVAFSCFWVLLLGTVFWMIRCGGWWIVSCCGLPGGLRFEFLGLWVLDG